MEIFEIKDIIIMVLLVALVAQSVLTRNLIPIPVVKAFLNFAEAKAADTPDTTDDEIVKAARQLILNGLLPDAEPPTDSTQ